MITYIRGELVAVEEEKGYSYTSKKSSDISEVKES